MIALFVELPPFQRYRRHYLDDDDFRLLQFVLLESPEAGDLIQHTGGLRKLRYADDRRGKGKRGGLRVIYYWWPSHRQIWLFTLYSKDEQPDLDLAQRRTLAKMLNIEIRERQYD